MRLARVGCWVACAVALTAGGRSVPPRAATLAVPPRAGTATASPVAGYTLANAALTVGIATDCGGVPIDLVNRADDHALAGVRAYEPAEHLVTTNPRTRERRLWIGGSDAKLPLAWSVGYTLAAEEAVLVAEVKISNLSFERQTVPVDFLKDRPGAFTSALPIVEAVPQKDVVHPAFIVQGWDLPVPTNLVLQAGVTRAFSRWWYPVMGLGGLKAATRFAALNFAVTGTPGELFLGIHTPGAQANCTVEVRAKGEVIFARTNVAFSASLPWCRTLKVSEDLQEKDVRVNVRAANGSLLVAYPASTHLAVPVFDSPNVQDLLVKAFKLRHQGDSAAASKTLRAVTAIAPLDPVAAVERIFLEDDGEGAVETLVKTRGFTEASFRQVRDFYQRLRATKELNEWLRQGRTMTNWHF